MEKRWRWRPKRRKSGWIEVKTRKSKKKIACSQYHVSFVKVLQFWRTSCEEIRPGSVVLKKWQKLLD